ncbi:MAG: flagellar biosynthetic protein FliR, partial [Gammaproteobacteria bacterium]
MQFALADIMTWISGLMWPFMRIGAMFMVAPMFGARNVPVRLRLLLALVLAWVMSLVLPPPPAVDPISLEAVVISIQQVVIGLAMGFILQMVFSVLAMAGENIAYGMGLGFATLVDPENGVQVPVVGQYFLILATLMFLGLDGHLILIEMLAESFRSLPVGGVGMERDVFWLIAGWGSRMFEWSLLVSLPVVASL